MADEKLLLIIPYVILLFIVYCVFFNEMNNAISKCCNLCKISKMNRIIYPEVNRITETEATLLTIVVATPITIIEIDR